MEAVAGFLRQTFDFDQNVRMNAELQLREIILSAACDLSIRQSSAIYFKNIVQRHWDTQSLSEQDKVAIKEKIVFASVETPSSISKYQNDDKSNRIEQKWIHVLCNLLQLQLLRCISRILSVDYPDNWPSFLPSLAHMLQSDNVATYLAALSILKELVGVYRWRAAEKREPLEVIIAQAFPLILSKSDSVAALPHVEVGAINHLTCKIYYSAIQYEISPTLQAQDSLVAWGNYFMKIIKLSTPAAVASLDPAEQEENEFWKGKKWAYHCIFHIFTKYSNPTYVKESKYEAFGKTFIEMFVPMILQDYLKQVELYTSGQWLSSRVKQQLSLFFSECVKYKTCWNLMKPYLQDLLAHFIFPMLCFSEQDSQIWEEDPVEYVQSKLDPMKDYRSPAAAAKELLVALVKSRHKATFMPIMTFITQMLDLNREQSLVCARKKDGALALLTAIADYVMQPKSPIYKDIPNFLGHYVLPEFDSPFSFLRARACDVLMVFGELDDLPPVLVKNIYESVTRSLQDSELPVRVWAALCLRPLLQHESVRGGLQPHAGEMMQVLLKLANEIDMDTLTDVMEEFVDHFSDELIPFAVQLGSQLRDTFMRIVSDMNFDINDETVDFDESTDKTLAALGVLKTLSTLVLAVESSKKILSELESVLIPICAYVFQNNAIDLYDEAFNLIDTCTYCAKSVSQPMWELFPLVYRTYKTDGIDFLEEMLPSLDNYITYGKEVIAQNPQLLNMFMDIVFTAFQREDNGEDDLVRACQLLESVLLNLRGSVDEHLPVIVNLAVPYILKRKFKTASFKVHIFEVVVNSLFYNPVATVMILDQQQATAKFFESWLEEMADFCSVCALLGLLETPIDRLPASIAHQLPILVKAVLKAMDGYQDALDERERRRKMINGEGSEAEDDMDDDLEDLIDDLEDGGIEEGLKSDQVFDHLVEEAAKAAKEHDDEDDDEWGYEDYALEEDPMFETMLDAVDIQARIKQVLGSLAPELQQHIAAALDANSQQQLGKLMA